MAKTDTYSKNYIIPYEEGDRSLQRVPYTYKEDINDRAYTLKDEDSLTAISYRYYGTPRYWFLIADINKILNPFELTTGQDIIIPNLERYDI